VRGLFQRSSPNGASTSPRTISKKNATTELVSTDQ
jgi:hypothetical protein